jgi:biotin synthase
MEVTVHSIRASAATAVKLRLADWDIAVEPTTLYFMLGDHCHGQCSYCTQGGASLSRVRWPRFQLDDIVARLPTGARRICLQTRYYPEVINDVSSVVASFESDVPISVSMNPVERTQLERLQAMGIERIGIGLDCCTPRLFKELKYGVPSWEKYLQGLLDARDIFGTATAHLIIGLGETDSEAIDMMQWLTRNDIHVALFAHHPLHGDTPPQVERYRYLQLVRYLLETGRYDNGESANASRDDVAAAARTSGCPECNRPFYNERVRGPLYNYPRPLNEAERDRAIEEVQKYVRLHCTDK